MPNDTGMRRTVAVLAAAGSLALPGTPATAGPSDPIVMTAAEGKQHGSLRHFTQSRKDGRTCATLHADGTNEQPAAVGHDGGRLVWRLPDARRPKEVVLTRTRWVAPGVYVSVEGTQPLDATVRPVRSRGRVRAWDVVSAPVGDGDMDLVLTVRWRHACADDEASYRYHAWAR